MGVVDKLYRAIEENDLACATNLLNNETDLINSTAVTPPPIHWAIYQDRPKMVDLLLEHGADIELLDQDRDATPLDYAIVYGRRNIIANLVSHGANLDGKLELATRGASGGFEEYGELPSPEVYREIADQIRELSAAADTCPP